MRNKITGFLIVFITICMFCTSISYGESESQLQDMIEQTANSLQNSTDSKEKYLLRDEMYMPAGSSSSDWTAMVLAFAGTEDAYADYLKSLEEFVVQQYEENGYLDKVKVTEYERIALTMIALGGDPTKVKVQGDEVNLLADGIYNFQGESLDLQGANGLVYGLLALDALDYEVPEDAKFTRESILEQLLSYQSEDGGFGFGGNSEGDVDITAMALQALAPYINQERVQVAVDKALEWLSKHMTQEGTFVSYGSESAETTAQVVLALCALGIDPEVEEMFLKDEITTDGNSTNKISVLDGLNSFRLDNGMYMHTLSDGVENNMATYQALLALEAVEKLRDDGTWILDFAKYTPPESANNNGVIIVTVVVAVLLISASIVIWKTCSKRSKRTEEKL